MEIYGAEDYPNPTPVRMVLAENGAADQVEFIPVDMRGGEHRPEAFKAKNSDAKVSCLELEDGSHISQCKAITEYIDGQIEGSSLTDEPPKEYAHISMVNMRTETRLLNADITAFAGLALADFAKIEIPDTLVNLTA